MSDFGAGLALASLVLENGKTNTYWYVLYAP
jgi:hypothetical protein